MWKFKGRPSRARSIARNSTNCWGSRTKGSSVSSRRSARRWPRPRTCMPAASRERLERLVAQVEGFYVRDRKLRRAQAEMSALLASGAEIPPAGAAAYLDAVRRYFEGFEREARAHVREVEKRLARASQVHFNLTAECGVAARRVEVTQALLSQLAN